MRPLIAAVSLAVAVMALAGCASGGDQALAPVEVIKINDPPTPPVASGPVERPAFHTVRRGETLGSIALQYGLDYRSLALWNALPNPDLIEVGKRLRLGPGSNEPEVSSVQPQKLKPQPLGTDADEASLSGGQVTRTQIGVGDGVRQTAVIEVGKPEAIKIPYSAEDYERLRAQAGGPTQAALVIRAQDSGGAPRNEQERNGIVWSWPVNGKLFEKYSDTNKGVDIGGAVGLPVYSSAGGKVIYAGSGLKGYGQMVIVKHANEYLSTYAHNSKIVVAEGEAVKRGQKIAEMGSSGSERVGLHFEIRRGSNTYDPLSFLPRSP